MLVYMYLTKERNPHTPVHDSRGSNENGVSRLYIIVEIYHSGRKPSNCITDKNVFVHTLLETRHACSYEGGNNVCLFICH